MAVCWLIAMLYVHFHYSSGQWPNQIPPSMPFDWHVDTLPDFFRGFLRRDARNVMKGRKRTNSTSRNWKGLRINSRWGHLSISSTHWHCFKEKRLNSTILGFFQALMDEKLAAIEKNKNDVISKVKQTANKLKFTLKGSIARDQEYLQMALIASKERLTKLEQIVTDATAVLQRVPDRPDVSVSSHDITS